METKDETIKRIALIGPESTAKSTLTEALALHYNTNFVAEYAREYLQKINRKYTLNDVIEIAKKQFEKEQLLLVDSNHFIFVDTEAIIAKVWCMDVFGHFPDWIKNNIQNHPYDLYLLTYPDIPWKPDSLRENAHRRNYFFEVYENELKVIGANYAIIKGFEGERLENCILLIDKHFSAR
jgi:NadR type nicotinamide-nucleotide adenylyltransferase